MSGGLNPSITKALRKRNFEMISSYICEIFEVAVNDCLQSGLKLPNDENKISNIIVEEYLQKQRKTYNMQNYYFTREELENYDAETGEYIGRVDIRILLKSGFKKENAYYIAECKRLDGTETLNEKYVREGIARFVTEKYISYQGANFMLGYIVKSINIPNVVKDIERIQNLDAEKRMHAEFNHLEKDGVADRYECMYKTLCSDTIVLRHLFLDLSDIVSL